MLLHIQLDPSETPTSATVKNYPAITSATGSPFSGGSLAHIGSGVWSINVGAITGNWIVHALATTDLIGWGYASSDSLDGSIAPVMDSPPWLAPPGSGLTASQTRDALGLEAPNLGQLVQALTGKNIVTDNLDGTFNVAIRNLADTADLIVIKVNPTTGDKEVV